MVETPDGGGHFDDVTLHPVVTMAAQGIGEAAIGLHAKASEFCIIESSTSRSTTTQRCCYGLRTRPQRADLGPDPKELRGAGSVRAPKVTLRPGRGGGARR